MESMNGLFFFFVSKFIVWSMGYKTCMLPFLCISNCTESHHNVNTWEHLRKVAMFKPGLLLLPDLSNTWDHNDNRQQPSHLEKLRKEKRSNAWGRECKEGGKY